MEVLDQLTPYMEKFWEFLPNQLDSVGLRWLGYIINFLVTTGIGPVLYESFKWFRKRQKKLKREKEDKLREEKRLAILKDLHPYFSELTVRISRELFIETQGQNIPPSRDLEPGSQHAFVSRAPLIPQFLNWAFESPGSEDRFFLVLADSGMGKTTFMINLYLRYIEETKGKELSIKLFPLNYPDIDKQILRITSRGEDEETILLLDGFDEDPEAIRDYSERMDKLISLVKNFREVVITSRTQFFPSEDAIPGEINIPRPGTRSPGFHRFKVIYLSPFDNEDIQEYIKKKFPGDSKDMEMKREKAQVIVNRSAKLMARPMLIAFIDELVESGNTRYKYTYQIYDILISKWINRESGKFPEQNRKKFREELSRFSQELAYYLFEKWKYNQEPIVTGTDLFILIERFEVLLTELEIRSRSLLNRDANGNLKFSHKSIMEYYLARRINNTSELFNDFTSFEGWSMIPLFLDELRVFPEMVSIPGGTFKFGRKDKCHVDDFEIGQFPITYGFWKVMMNWTPLEGEVSDMHPIDMVSWEDAQNFIKKLNSVTMGNFRLPTEIEWEYAARGAQNSQNFKYAGGNQLDTVAWYHLNSNYSTQPVGKKKPNECGIYDMSGNVWEWCSNIFEDNDPKRKTSNNRQFGKIQHQRVIRGGGAGDYATTCQVTTRDFLSNNIRKQFIGFRLARSLSDRNS